MLLMFALRAIFDASPHYASLRHAAIDIFDDVYAISIRRYYALLPPCHDAIFIRQPLIARHTAFFALLMLLITLMLLRLRDDFTFIIIIDASR